MNNIMSNNNYGLHMHKYISPNHLLVILLFSSATFAMNLEEEFGEYQCQFLPEDVQASLNIPIVPQYNLRKRNPTMITQNDEHNSLDSEVIIPVIKKAAFQIPAEIIPEADSSDEGKLAYYCKINKCSKKYTTLWYLKRHYITHSNERPFICPECNNGFKFNYHLKAHLNVIHSDAHPHSCIVCLKSFKRLSDLNKHTRRTHAMKCPRKEPIQQLPAQSSPPIIPLQ